MPVEEQIAVIFAGVNRYLDDLPVEQVKRFEQEYLHFLHGSYPHILKDIREKKALDEEVQEELKKSILEFKERFASVSEASS